MKRSQPKRSGTAARSGRRRSRKLGAPPRSPLASGHRVAIAFLCLWAAAAIPSPAAAVADTRPAVSPKWEAARRRALQSPRYDALRRLIELRQHAARQDWLDWRPDRDGKAAHRNQQPERPHSDRMWQLSDTALRILGWTALTLAVLVALVAIFAALRRAATTNTLKQTLTEAAEASGRLIQQQRPGEAEPEVYERRALQAARRGDITTALRELLLGSMAAAERAGCIRFRPGLTNRDYLRAFGNRPDAHRAFQLIAENFERAVYGHHSVAPDEFRACWQHFRNTLRNLSQDGRPA